MHFKLVLNKPEFSLMDIDKGKYKYKIEIDNAVFLCTQGDSEPRKRLTRNRHFQCIFGTQPTFILMGLVDSAGKHGDITRNPFDFQHKGLNSLNIHIDGIQYPTIPIRPNFSSGEWVRPYQEFFNAAGQYHGSDAPEISYEEYRAFHTLCAVNLSPALSALDGSHFNLIKNGAMRINLHLEKALYHNMSIVVLAVFQNIIEIDKSRNVTTYY